MQLNVSVTPIIGARVSVGIEGYGAFGRLERQD
jgi:hypothetical protein